MKTILIIYALLFISCDVENKVDGTLKSFVGKDYNLIIDNWGQPTQRYLLPNGNEVLYYLRIGDVTSPSPTFTQENGDEIPNSCRIFFEVGKDFIVLKYTYEGTSCWDT